MTFFAIRLVAAAALATATAVAATAAPVTPPSAKINYADLDLSTPTGVIALDRRVRQAARQVCGPAELGNRMIVMDCRNRVQAAARETLARLLPDDAVRLASAR